MYPLRSNCRLIAALALFALCALAPAALAGQIEDDYAAAAGHYSAERYDKAVTGFRKLLAIAPQHPLAGDIRFFLAESLLQQQPSDVAGAAKEFAALVAEQPQHRYAQQASFRIAETTYLQGEYAAALPKLKAFVAAHSASPLCEHALVYLGDCELELGHPHEAQDAYQLALKQFPTGARVGASRLGLARAAEQQGDLVNAKRFYEFLARQQKNLSEESAIAAVQLGRLHYQQGELAAAAQILSAAVKTSHAERTEACYWYGLVLTAQKNVSAAQSLWREVIDDKTEHSFDAACALALAQSMADNDAGSAMKLCQRIARDWPESSSADAAAAFEIDLLLAERKYDELANAVAAFQRDHARSGRLYSVRAAHARALLEQGQCEQAIALLEPLTQIKSQNMWEWTYLLALAQMGTKQFEAGLATLSKIPLKRSSASRAPDRPGTIVPPADDDLRAAILSAKGSALVALKRGAEAIEPLEQIVKEFPDAADAATCRARLCVAYVQSRKLPEARSAWQKLCTSHADDPALLPLTLYLAEEATTAGQHELARECLEFAADSSRPAEIRQQALQQLAALAQQAKSPEAAKSFGTLLKAQPKDEVAAGVALQHARQLAREKQPEAALAAYLQWLKDFPNSVERPAVMLTAANLHRDLQQHREALALLEELLAKHADFPRLDEVHYQMADCLVALNRRDEARQQYELLHDQHTKSPNWQYATYWLAEQHVLAKRYSEADALLTELVENPAASDAVPHALLLKGQAAAAAQKWEDVSAPLENLLAKHPKSELRTIAKYWIAESCYRRGKWADAGKLFAELSTELDKTSDAWAPLVPLRQAQVLAHQQQWPEAHDVAAAIARKYPQFRQQHEVDYLLGRCLGAQAEFDAAREAFQRVVQSPVGGRSETAAMAQWMIGETYFQQERYEDAISAYHKVERLYAIPRWQAAALLQAGKCHETQGEYTEAIQLYAQLLKEHSQTTVAQEASQRLRVAEQRAANVKTKTR